MYFKSYNPTTLTDNAARARATRMFDIVRDFCGKENPTVRDYIAYKASKMNTFGPALYAGWVDDRRAEWAEIIKTVRQCGTSPNGKPVVYFAIIDGGVKCGQTANIVDRHCQINADTPIQHMWYMELESKEQARKAEHALHGIFDHALNMYREENKQDYYSCSAEQAQKFITANAKKMYQAIMEKLEMEKGE